MIFHSHDKAPEGKQQRTDLPENKRGRPYNGSQLHKSRLIDDLVPISVGTCARAYGTACHHEHACVRCSPGTRVPRPKVLPRLAAAVVAPTDLCTEERERLVHLRVWSGRSRAAMAEALRMTEETCRLLEATGRLGRAVARYERRLDCWARWEEWAAPVYGVAPQRLAAATAASREYWPVL